MSLQTFCFVCLLSGLVLLIAGALIEAEIEYRRRQIKRVRDLKDENRRLRAQLHHERFESGWELDEAKTALAVKDMLLRQKWANANKIGGS